MEKDTFIILNYDIQSELGIIHAGATGTVLGPGRFRGTYKIEFLVGGCPTTVDIPKSFVRIFNPAA